MTQVDRTLTISSQIAGADGLQKNGLGTLILSGSNNYTGITTVSAGTLRVGHANALGTATDTNHTIVGSGATLDLNGFSIGEQFGKSSVTQTDGFLDSTSILTNSSATAAAVTGGIFFNNGGAFTVNGSNGGITLNTVSNTVPSGTITLTKSGANTLTLAGTVDNSYLAMSVSAGTVILGKTSSASVHAVGSGLTLNNAAIVQLGGTGNDQIFDNSDVTLNNTSILDMNGKNETINGLTGVSGTTIYNTANGTASTLTVGNANGTTAFGGVIANNAGGGQTGTLAVTKLGTGTLTLSGSNTYTGGTRVSAGVLSVNTIADSGTSAIGTAGTLFLSGGTLAFTGTTGITARAVTLTVASGLDVATSGTLTLNGAVSGGFNLTKTGNGLLVLGGTADNGDLRLNVTSGVVELNKTTNATSRAVAGIFAIANGATVKLTGTNGDQIFGGSNSTAYGIHGVAGTLDLNGKSESTNFLNGTSTGVVDGSSGTPTLTVGEQNVSSTFAGTIKNTTGTLGLTKIGSGTLTLSGNNSYSGVTAISAGILAISHGCDFFRCFSCG